MTIYDKIEKMILDFNMQVLSLAQQNQDLNIENSRLNKLVDAYRAKANLLIELTAPIDMHSVLPLTVEEEIIIERELKRVK